MHVHSPKENRYRCDECGRTVSGRAGTVFFRLRTAEEIVSLVVLLVAHGCPIQAIVAAFKFDERTVTDWLERAGVQCRAVHEVVVGCPQALGQVQMDELRVKIQGKIVWMAMAMAVQTRLWLGGAVSLHRDGVLIERLVEQVKRCASALAGPILFCTDGFAAYVGVIRDVFRESVVSGKRGRPEKHPWPGILIAQVVKRYERGRLAGVVRRVVQGTAEQVEAVRRASQGDGVINTAFIERLNATFRSGLAALVRRTRALARKPETLERGMFLVGVVYNLCTDHDSLRLPGLVGGRKHLPQTPAMAAGLTDHRWSIHELLSFRVPVPHWSPPKRRGRVSNAVKAQIQKWK